MAPEDVRTRKRKVAADTDPKPKKQKKSIPSTPLINDAVKAVGDAVVKSKRKQTEDAPAQETPKKVKKSEAAPDAPKIAAKADEPVKEQTRKSKKSKKSKPSEDATATAVLDLPEDDNLNGGDEIVAVIEKKVKGSKKSKKSEPKPVEPSGDIEEDEDDEVDDDQTAALLAGFESEGDESEAEQEETSLDEKALMKQVPDGLTKELKGVSRKGQDTGVVFLGRIPHGFYEKQIQKYFSQFGNVNKVRVSRNKKTGASKHYAFIEFANSEVADIVAKTMDKYLMFGRILQCRVVAPEQVHEKLFDGANRRFRKIPRNKIAGAEMKHGATREVWAKRTAKAEKRESLRARALKEKMGYEYHVPKLRQVDDVPVRASAIEEAPAQLALPEPPKDDVNEAVNKDTEAGHQDIAEAPRAKKGKEAKKVEADVPEPAVVPKDEVEKKVKKEKKRKSLDVAEGTKVKKSKKSKA